ncbi:TetR/AcrR family transcriptional regulator [Bradyrhizobium commune]|uniref:TetR/AcrR family transcriptional regulator n=1 Tax=Bradyrhizobium commune TaxID=83627 RepID=A0A7S9D919_9BRAD|nr:TetR/AcrR family transcriptional regulator [Bradyrhizobium commune]QPF93456.1 TetR/AcrR family transcriptional regulator [Bradyrhizobium commune]
MAGRPREFDREAALEAAMVLFWRKGYASASMNDLCDAMGVRSPSLYAAFESKEALYLAAIEHYVLTQGQPVWDRLADGATARAGIGNLLVAAAETLPKSRTAPAGCMAVLGAVSDEWPPTIARMVKKLRLDMLGNLRARLEAAIANGELPAATDIDALSRFYLSVFQGMAIQAKDGATPAELKGAVAAAMAAWPGEGER